MFTTVDEVQNLTGYAVDGSVLNLANTLVEIYVGRVDEDVTDASDREILGNAVALQAIYIKDNPDDILMQAAIKSSTRSDSIIAFHWEQFSPFMSPWAVKACQRLSWFRSRSVTTGPVFSGPVEGWAYRWLTE